MNIVALLDPIGKIIDRVLPDQKARDAAKLEMLRMSQEGELEQMRTQMSAILAEAQAADPWTSRARPSFLYVMYLLLLWSLPMGVLAAFAPGVAERIVDGMTGYLAAIPEPLYALFGTGYLGYSAMRQWGKVKGSDK